MTTSETKPGELTYANQVVHESHDASLIEVLKCLTDLRFREAITGWRALCEALEAHAKLEEEEVFRAYAALGSVLVEQASSCSLPITPHSGKW